MELKPNHMNSSKEQLAKLLATEDITVRISPRARTASFDVQKRVLTLPDWSCSNASVLDMMTGHEVGHSLWTSFIDWSTSIKDGYHTGILNVVEDARIEKKIKRKYPGLVRHFIMGYRQLEEQGFFYESESEISRFNLLDRINLHFKCGDIRGIPFEDWERKYVRMVDGVESFDDVKKVTRILMELMSDLQDEQDSDIEFGNGKGDPSDGSDADGEPVPGDKSDSKEDNDNSSLSSNKNSNDGEIDAQSLRDLRDSIGEDLVESQERFDSKKESLNKASEDGRKEITYFNLPDPNLKEIIVSYKDVAKEVKSQYEGVIKKAADGHDGYEGYATYFIEQEEKCWQEFNQFRNSSKKIVGYMAKEFERKKAASEYRKESISKTGVLDLNKIHQYKFNDDLFLRNTIRPDGKNHGMVMLVDWSASMTSHLKDTAKQVMSLVSFCQKVNIPFEVYAFSNTYRRPWKIAMRDDHGKLDEELIRKFREYQKHPTWDLKVGMAEFSGSDTHLLNWFSSRMTAKETSNMMRMFWRLAYGEVRMYRDVWGPFSMGSTPLVEGLVCMKDIIPAFVKKYSLDKTSLIVLTDGDGNTKMSKVIVDEDDDEINNDPIRRGYMSCSSYRNNVSILEDPLTRKTYKLDDMNQGWRNSDEKKQERAVLTLLKDRYNLSTIGIFLDNESKGRSLRQSTLNGFIGYKYGEDGIKRHRDARQMCRKTGVAPIEQIGYDEFYIVPAGTIEDYVPSLEIDGNMTVGKIKNAFKKTQNAKFGNKVLVNRMMDIIA